MGKSKMSQKTRKNKTIKLVGKTYKRKKNMESKDDMVNKYILTKGVKGQKRCVVCSVPGGGNVYTCWGRLVEYVGLLLMDSCGAWRRRLGSSCVVPARHRNGPNMNS